MAAQAGLNLTWSEIPEDTFCRVVDHLYFGAILTVTLTISCYNVQCIISAQSACLWYKPSHDITSKMTCAAREDSDHPGHPPSLISLRCLHEEALGP